MYDFSETSSLCWLLSPLHIFYTNNVIFSLYIFSQSKLLPRYVLLTIYLSQFFFALSLLTSRSWSQIYAYLIKITSLLRFLYFFISFLFCFALNKATYFLRHFVFCDNLLASFYSNIFSVASFSIIMSPSR